MQITLNIGDALYARATVLYKTNGEPALAHEGLGTLIEHESARRFAAMGGTEPNTSLTPRSQFTSVE
ncbi:MAG: hypothetical protein P8I38_01080 [Arenicella sp.]|jgi:hypothetical protein|nr:hypothetical protein [Arenicella sp.]